MTNILIIEDEKGICEAIEYNLKKEGFRVYKAFDGIEGIKIAREKIPELIILDLMLPGKDGLEICKELKKETNTMHIPIIILTAKSEEVDRVLGLELGADDYVTKPFSMRELMARVKAVLKRYEISIKGPYRPAMKFGDLEIDADKHEVKVNGVPVDLTAKEFALLHFIAENKEKAISREKLLDIIWGVDVAIETRTIDVHVKRLRNKLGEVGGRHIKTLRSIGYKFIP